MKRRYAPTTRLAPSLESIALTDIIMNLFIFFFVTFAIAYIPKTQKSTSVSVELPRAGKGAAKPGAPIVVSVQFEKPDLLFLGDKAVTYAELPAAIAALPAEQRASGALLRGDRRITLEQTLKTIDALRAAGLPSVTIATQPGQ